MSDNSRDIDEIPLSNSPSNGAYSSNINDGKMAPNISLNTINNPQAAPMSSQQSGTR